MTKFKEPNNTTIGIITLAQVGNKLLINKLIATLT